MERVRADQKPADYYAPRKRLEPTLRTVRSSISNGTELLHDLDHRSAWARRLRDLIRNFEQDLGGRDLLSEGQIGLVRRCAMMQLQLELLEQKFADNDGNATSQQLNEYQRVSNSLRRIVESLGINRGRRSKQIMSPLDYAKAKQIEAAE